MDDADRAKLREQADRRIALETQRARARESDPPLEIDGVRHCVDCGEPIPPARLAARPEAVRCIACKERKERQDQMYR